MQTLVCFRVKKLEEEVAMDKAFRNPLFLCGIPLVVCGFSFGLTGLLADGTFAYVAPGLLIPGGAFMLIGWMQKNN